MLRHISAHLAPEERTPVEAFGIEIKGSNKWIILIQNAKVNEDKDRKEKLEDFV
jgi:hypothetical protein